MCLKQSFLFLEIFTVEIRIKFVEIFAPKLAWFIHKTSRKAHPDHHSPEDFCSWSSCSFLLRYRTWCVLASLAVFFCAFIQYLFWSNKTDILCTMQSFRQHTSSNSPVFSNKDFPRSFELYHRIPRNWIMASLDTALTWQTCSVSSRKLHIHSIALRGGRIVCDFWEWTGEGYWFGAYQLFPQVFRFGLCHCPCVAIKILTLEQTP